VLPELELLVPELPVPAAVLWPAVLCEVAGAAAG
jgi:hypothetical protein